MIHPSKMWSSTNLSLSNCTVLKSETQKFTPWHLLLSHCHIQSIQKFCPFYLLNISQINLLLSISTTPSINSCLALSNFLNAKISQNYDGLLTSTLPFPNKTLQLTSIASRIKTKHDAYKARTAWSSSWVCPSPISPLHCPSCPPLNLGPSDLCTHCAPCCLTISAYAVFSLLSLLNCHSSARPQGRILWPPGRQQISLLKALMEPCTFHFYFTVWTCN